LRQHIDYVHFNPVKHGWAKQVVDWPHSSFHTYVGLGTLPRDWAGVTGDLDAAGFGERG